MLVTQTLSDPILYVASLNLSVWTRSGNKFVVEGIHSVPFFLQVRWKSYLICVEYEALKATTGVKRGA